MAFDELETMAAEQESFDIASRNLLIPNTPI